MSNFCVGLVGGGRDGWGELRSEPRAAHVFFIFQIKKELFIFIFQIKSISKGTFWKKGTKWQSLVNSLKVITPIWHYLLSFEHLEIINTFESSKSISSFEITLWPQYTCFIKDHIFFWKYFWIFKILTFIWNLLLLISEMAANCLTPQCQLRCSSAQYVLCKVYFSAQTNKLRPILKFKKYYPIEHKFVPACSIARKIHFFKF